MISVLIPVYNIDVRELVQEVYMQLSASGKAYEILLLDDGSTKEMIACNTSCIFRENISFSSNDVNRGRVYTRNKLAARAQFSWLLFLDADCKIVSENFIEDYLKSANDEVDVICGGTNYISVIPEDCRYRLHWKYANERVGISNVRQVGKKGFLFNNILIRKSFYHQLQFPEILKGYGHEDTWVGIQIDHLQAKIKDINNPVLHDDLDTNEVFFQKQQSALNNLKALATYTSDEILGRHVRIFRYYLYLRKTGLQNLFYQVIAIFERRILANLFGCNPSLFLFDLIRLKLFIRIMKNDK
jgi:glycosyltransferase involved in cell wall biosynthesis